jgi:hypothetical protein
MEKHLPAMAAKRVNGSIPLQASLRLVQEQLERLATDRENSAAAATLQLQENHAQLQAGQALLAEHVADITAASMVMLEAQRQANPDAFAAALQLQPAAAPRVQAILDPASATTRLAGMPLLLLPPAPKPGAAAPTPAVAAGLLALPAPTTLQLLPLAGSGSGGGAVSLLPAQAAAGGASIGADGSSGAAVGSGTASALGGSSMAGLSSAAGGSSAGGGGALAGAGEFDADIERTFLSYKPSTGTVIDHHASPMMAAWYGSPLGPPPRCPCACMRCAACCGMTPCSHTRAPRCCPRSGPSQAGVFRPPASYDHSGERKPNVQGQEGLGCTACCTGVLMLSAYMEPFVSVYPPLIPVARQRRPPAACRHARRGGKTYTLSTRP